MSTVRRGADDPLLILQFTDTHLYAEADGRLMGVDTQASFSEVVRLAASEHGQPDCVLMTGDLSQDESAHSYRRLAEIVQTIGAPCYYLPGNHDNPALMNEVFAEYSPPLWEQRTVELDGWQVILLDSTIRKAVAGHIGQSQLNLLNDALGSSNKFALVCLHHHPVPVKSAWIDQIGVDNQKELFAVINAHKQVRAIIWGHVHQEFDEQQGDVRLLATPSTCVQFKPGNDAFALDSKLPGYRWLKLYANGSIETAVSRLKDYALGLDMAASGY